MQPRRWSATLLVVGMLAGCAADGSYAARHPQIRVTVRSGCPATLGRAHDVENSPGGLTGRLVPDDAAARGGLVCEYDGKGQTVRPDLGHSTRLDRAGARKLAHSAGAISLERPSGSFACPAAFARYSIIVLNYAGRADVDLWYATSGCQTLDNGHTQASQAANRSFYEGFETTYARVVGHS